MPVYRYDKVLAHWIGLIRPLFPADAKFRGVSAGEDVFIVIVWTIGDNPSQRKVRKNEITFAEDAMNE